MKKNVYVFLAIIAACVAAGLIFFIAPARKPVVPQRFWAAKYTPDGKTLVTVGGQHAPNDKPALGEFIFWDPASGKSRSITQQKWGVRGIDISPDGKFIALGDFGGATKLVNPSDGKTLGTFLCKGPVNAVAISADSKWVVSATLNGNLSIVEVKTGHQDMHSFANESFINLALSPIRNLAVATTRSGKAILIELERDLPPVILDAAAGATDRWSSTDAVAFASDGLTLATGSRTTLRLWETDTGKLIREIPTLPSATNSPASTATNSTASASPETTSEKRPTDVPRLTAVGFSQDGTTLITVNYVGGLALWSVANGDCLKSVVAHAGPCYSISFSPDTKRIATVGRNDETVRIWDSQSLELISSFKRTSGSR